MYLAANLRCSCVIKTLCYKAAMSSVQGLRAFVTERLTAAAAEILGAFEKTMEEYEAEIGRQRRLLDSVFKPDVKLHRIEELADQPAHKEEQVLSNQHLCGQRNKSSLDQKDPHAKVKEEQEQLCIVPEGEQLLLKQETDDLTWIPPCGESVHDEAEPIIEHQLSSSSSPVTYSVHRSPTSETHSKTPKHKSTLKCVTCGKLFKYNSIFQRHLSSHTAEKPHACDTCGKRFSELSSLKVHLRLHRPVKYLKDQELCHITTDPFRDQQSVCPSSTATHNAHISSSLGTHGQHYECDCCGKVFRCQSNFQRHMRVHTGEKPYICHTCGNRFRQASTLKSHLSIHTGERPHVCTTCGKRFCQASNLKNHLSIHTGERPHVCHTCGKSFRQASTLKNHLSIHTGEKPYVCNTCGKSFRQASNMKAHLRIHTDKIIFKCKTNINKHLITFSDHKPFPCRTCGKRFRNSSQLKNHLRVHTGERPYHCEICGREFKQHGALNYHLKVHTGEKPHQCNTCGKRFVAKNDLVVHQRVHTGERPYSCKMCGQKFKQLGTLISHSRVHTGEKPYVCQTCGKQFIQKTHMKTHMRNHHTLQLN